MAVIELVDRDVNAIKKLINQKKLKLQKKIKKHFQKQQLNNINLS